MIKNFADKETERVFRQEFSRKLPPEVQRRTLAKLMMLDAAETEQDLTAVPGNHFEALKGKYVGFYSIRVNAQWRIVFRIKAGEVSDVSITDYH